MTAFLLELGLATAIAIGAAGLAFKYWKKEQEQKQQLREKDRPKR